MKSHAKCAKTPEGREYLRQHGKMRSKRAHDVSTAPNDDDSDD